MGRSIFQQQEVVRGTVSIYSSPQNFCLSDLLNCLPHPVPPDECISEPYFTRRERVRQYQGTCRLVSARSNHRGKLAFIQAIMGVKQEENKFQLRFFRAFPCLLYPALRCFNSLVGKAQRFFRYLPCSRYKSKIKTRFSTCAGCRPSPRR
jgi:hypothetical protein